MSLIDVDVDDDDDDGEMDLSDASGPNVHLQSRLRFRRPATGVSGQESLSDSEESRLSPIRGPLGRGELSRDENGEGREGMISVGVGSEAGLVLMDSVVAGGGGASDSSEDEVASDDMVETEDSRSEWRRVNLTVWISSSSGVRNDTFFSAGNSGLGLAIFRESSGAGPLERMERRLCGCL